MRICTICRFEVPPDDVELASSDGWSCVCTRCYHRLTDSEKRADKHLREQAGQAAGEMPN